MTLENCQNIVKAIKLDNVVLFSNLTSNDLNLKLGRFPLLSLCYLYNAKNILKKYEKALVTISNFVTTYEPLEISNHFSVVAGKSLRLYLHNQTVFPVEMLAILGLDNKVKKMVKLYLKHKIEINENNLKTIYLTKNQSFVLFNNIAKISVKRLSKPVIQLYKLALCVSAVVVLVITAVFGGMYFTSGLGLKFSPYNIQTASQLYSALNSNGYYKLNNDIVLTKAPKKLNFNGEFDGGNYKITVKMPVTKSLILSNDGSIKNLNIEYQNLNTEINNNLGLVCQTNNGTMENVNVTCSSIDMTCNTIANTTMYISGVSAANYGSITNCKITLNGKFKSTGDGECLVAGVVGDNYGKITNCNMATGSLTGEETDVSGICATNNVLALVDGCVNNSTIYQTSVKSGWSPTVAGIVLTNNGDVNNSVNHGDLTITCANTNTIDDTAVVIGGIAGFNTGNVYKCLNKGDLKVTSLATYVYAGGITAQSSYRVENNNAISPTIDSCGVQGNIDVSTQGDSVIACVGGITGYLYGNMSNNYSVATFTNGFLQNKYFVGLTVGVGAVRYDFLGSYLLINAENNHVLYQENVNYHMGGLSAGGGVSQTEITLTNGITDHYDILDIKNESVYFE